MTGKRVELWGRPLISLLLIGVFVGNSSPAAARGLIPAVQDHATTLIRNTMSAATTDWPTYLNTLARNGSSSTETTLTPRTAPSLQLKWSAPSGGGAYSQPIEANNRVYWGSWDGYERATTLSGTSSWKTFLGQEVASCTPTSVAGVTSTATIATEPINGVQTSVDYVGGGDAQFYALNALTGAILWKTQLGSAPDHYLWSSPAVLNGSVYIGVSSLGDCPLVQAQLVQLNASTGVIQHVFAVVPPGCTGGSVWGSPTIDSAGGTLYFVTGNSGSCSTAEPYAEALVRLRASDLTYLSSWQVPAGQAVTDGDFGSTPTLFTATSGGTMHLMVGVANKNGIYYAFDRTSISSGPRWKVQIAVGGEHPESGEGSIAPSAWDGTALYVAGGITTINGTTCTGSLRALNPASGAVLWNDCFSTGPIIGAVTLADGLAVVGAGTHLLVLATASGGGLFDFPDPNTTGGSFRSAASIAAGILYQSDVHGTLFALGLPTQLRLDAGSTGPLTDSVGDTWQADTGFSGGNVANRGSISISNTTDPALYQTEHYGMSSFSTALANGRYVVNLHFAETSAAVTGAGQRVFTASINGVTLTNIDPFAQAGGKDRALVDTVTVNVTSGVLNITFTSLTSQPAEINAIEILPTTKGIRVDAGSLSAYTDSVGDTWTAETGFVGGTLVNRGSITISNTTDPALYQTEHYGMSSFSARVPNGTYVVNLHFAETSTSVTAAGQRVFSVTVNGKTVSNLDPFGQTGGRNRAVTASVTVKVTTGSVSLTFTKLTTQPPEINAIEIVPTN